MPFLDLLSTERVRTELVVSDKESLLDAIAGVLAESADEEQAIHQALTEREAQGSTGLGRGVAIPHGRIDSLEKARAAFIRLAAPLEFGSIDHRPVDLIAALVVPSHFTNQHLQLLGELAEMFSDAELTTRLRNSTDACALRRELAEFALQRS
jgi:PTS system nitrogen regulatory IIA component